MSIARSIQELLFAACDSMLNEGGVESSNQNILGARLG
jgi:hypothetical protein